MGSRIDPTFLLHCLKERQQQLGGKKLTREDSRGVKKVFVKSMAGKGGEKASIFSGSDCFCEFKKVIENVCTVCTKVFLTFVPWFVPLLKGNAFCSTKFV